MKVLTVLTYYYPFWTGLSAFATDLAEGLAQNGSDVTVLTSRHEASLPSFEVINKVKVDRLWTPFRISRSRVMPFFLPSLIKHILKNDAIMVHAPFSDILFVALVGRLFHKKIYIVYQGDLLLPKGAVNRIIEYLYAFCMRLAVQMSQAVVIQTKDYAMHSRVLRGFPEKWRIILNTVKSLPSGGKKAENKSKPAIGFAGRFVEEKGFDYLLESIPHVLQVFPDAQFVFAGEKKMFYEDFYSKHEHLIKKYKKTLVFLGLLRSKQAMATFYNSLEVFVISSRSDCFPLTQVEAVLSGVPVVCTDIPGARWVVKKTGMGILVPSKNPTALAAGIIEVLKNRKKYIKPDTMIKTLFNHDKTVAQFAALIRS